MTKRGRILRDTNTGPGVLTVEGAQYTFTLEKMWRSDVPPRVGMPVDVSFAPDGVLEAVDAVSEGQIAREQAQWALSGVLNKGAAAKSGLLSRFGLPVVLAELLLLISFFLLPNMRIGNAFASRVLNGWDVLGLDPATTATNNHGILSLLALALFAPLAVPFIQKAWARWLYSAPLVFTAIAFVSVFYEIQNVGREAREAVGNAFGAEAVRGFGNPMAGMFSPSFGAFLVLLCSIYMLTRAFKASALQMDRVTAHS